MIAAKIEQALQDGQDYSYEHRMRTADGRRLAARQQLGRARRRRRARSDPDRLARHHRPEGGRGRTGALALVAAGDARRDRRRDLRRRSGRQSPPATAPWSELWQISQSLIDAGDHEAVLDHVADRVADPDEFRPPRGRDHRPGSGPSPPTTPSSSSTAGRSSATRRRSGSAARSSAVSGPSATSPRSWPRNGRCSDSDQRHREALEDLPLIAAAIDTQGTTTFANDALLKLTGWSREEVIGSDWFDRFDDNPYVRADYFQRLETGEIRPHFESTIRTRSGERRDIRWSSTIQHDESGAVAGIVTIGEDVTERNRADALLRSREQLFRSLIENASEVITILSVDGTSIFESPSVERVLGRTPEELVGLPSFALLHEDDVDARREDLRRDRRRRRAPSRWSSGCATATAPGARSRRSVTGAARTASGSWSSTTATSPTTASCGSSCCTRRSSRRLDGSRAGSRTTSTTC